MNIDLYTRIYMKYGEYIGAKVKTTRTYITFFIVERRLNFEKRIGCV